MAQVTWINTTTNTRSRELVPHDFAGPIVVETVTAVRDTVEVHWRPAAGMVELVPLTPEPVTAPTDGTRLTDVELADAIDLGEESWFWPVGGEKATVADVLRDLQATRTENKRLELQGIEIMRDAAKTERERDEARAQLGTVAGQLRQCIDERNHRIKERVAAEARLADVEARATFESAALDESYRRGFNNAMAQIRAALAAPSPQAQPAENPWCERCPTSNEINNASHKAWHARWDAAQAEPATASDASGGFCLGRCWVFHRPTPHTDAEQRACPATESEQPATTGRSSETGTREGRYRTTQARALWFCGDCGAVVPIEARTVHDRTHDA